MARKEEPAAGDAGMRGSWNRMRLLKKLLVAVGVAIPLLAILWRAGFLAPLLNARYLPHRYCYLAQPGLIWTNAIADGLIAISYAALFVYLFSLADRLRTSPEFRTYLWIFTCFGLFIGACGGTHVMEVITVWWPLYPLSAGVKVVCAVASVTTAVLFAAAAPELMRRIPAIVAMFSTTQRERDQARADLIAWSAIAAERERADALVHEAYQRMNHIMDSTSEGIFKLRTDWTILYANRQALETLSEIGLEKNYWDCFPEARGTIIEKNLHRSMYDRVDTEWENLWEPHGDWYAVHCFPSEGGVSVFFSKITARKRLEQELKAELQLREQREKAEHDAKEQLNHILDSSSEGVLKLDAQWTVLYANRKAKEISPELVVGVNFWVCYPQLRGTAAELGLHVAMDERREAHYEVYYAPYDEWFSVSAFPTPLGISVFYRKITVEKKLGEQLALERELREKRIEALSNMAGGLAHEISNPLAIVYGTANDLNRLAQTEPLLPAHEVLQASATIIKTSDRAIRILRGLRGFAREAGNDPMEYSSVYEIMEEAVQLQEARFERHGIDLRAVLPPDLPLLLCRQTQIGQILTNLVNNSYDAIVEQKCTERWVLLEVRANGEFLEFDVTDSGNGIDQEARKHLMEPFYTTKTRGLGMGVGLSLSRAIANEHGGTLELCTDTDHTRFRLSVPIEFQQESLVAAASEEVR